MAHAEVADIFRRYGPSYRDSHKLPLNHLRTMHAIETCRTTTLGGHVDECEECGHIKISYNSCRNRHCPKCQFLKKEKWIEARGKELLPIEYFHVVFTLPDELNPLALRNREVVYGILFKAASETLTDLAKKRLGVKIGFIAVLHTWGQNLMDHPHLHCIVSGGGLSQGKWISSKRRFLFPVRVMSRLFRGKFLAFLKKAFEKKSLQCVGEDFPGLLKGLYAKEWVVYAKPPFNGPQTVLGYLGRYTHRIAITNHRITGAENGKVSFLWKDYADGNKQKVMTLDASEFIRRFLLHVLPDGFVKIRHFGFLSNKHRKECLEACRTLLGVRKPEPALSETWQESLLRITGIDVTRCPLCEGRMRRKELYRGPP
jgi:Putative transposase/Transposase zinc-binding domain